MSCYGRFSSSLSITAFILLSSSVLYNILIVTPKVLVCYITYYINVVKSTILGPYSTSKYQLCCVTNLLVLHKYLTANIIYLRLTPIF